MGIKKLGIAAVALATLMATPAAAATTGYTFAGVADWDHDGHQDIVAHNAAGDLLLYPGQSVRGYSGITPVRIGNGWNGFTVAGIADWDRDGHADVLARNDVTSDLWLYPGESKRAYSAQDRVKIGNGWAGFTFAGVADWDGDGSQDIVARSAAGDLLLYPGQSIRGYSGVAPVQIGNGWNGFTMAGIADWDRDGHPDILARNDATSDLWLYPGESKRAYSAQQRVKIGNGWGGFTFAGLADWDHDGSPDLVARAPSGDLLLYPGQSIRGYSGVAPVKIGNGW